MISFNPYELADPFPGGQKGRAFRYTVLFTQNGVKYGVIWSRNATNDGLDGMEISISWTEKGKTRYRILYYDVKTKKLRVYSKK